MDLDGTVDEWGATLGAGRRRLAKVELGNALDSALAEVRSVGPERWRPQHRSRWPVVAGVLILGAAAAAFVYLLPTLQHALETHRLTEPDAGAQTGAVPRAEPIPYRTDPWGATSEERKNGEEAGF